MTFGGGGRKYRRAVRRICREAEAFGLFDGITGYTDESLRRDFPDFCKEHGAFIKANRRGYGCWLWKPFLILRHLQTMREGDILLFVDAGCELNPYGRQRLAEYLDLCAEHSILTFHLLPQSRFPVKHWTKMDTILRLDPDLQMVERPQHESGVILLKKTSATVNMAEEWFAVCAENNYHYLDDSESAAPNDRNFCEHRHDQAILTLLLVKHGLEFCLSGERYFEPGRWHIDGAQYPVWTSRHKSGFTSPRMMRLRVAKTDGYLCKALLCCGWVLSQFSMQVIKVRVMRVGRFLLRMRAIKTMGLRGILGRLGLRRWR